MTKIIMPKIHLIGRELADRNFGMNNASQLYLTKVFQEVTVVFLNKTFI